MTMRNIGDVARVQTQLIHHYTAAGRHDGVRWKVVRCLPASAIIQTPRRIAHGRRHVNTRPWEVYEKGLHGRLPSTLKVFDGAVLRKPWRNGYKRIVGVLWKVTQPCRVRGDMGPFCLLTGVRTKVGDVEYAIRVVSSLDVFGGKRLDVLCKGVLERVVRLWYPVSGGTSTRVGVGARRG
jgi:hypothetical protein